MPFLGLSNARLGLRNVLPKDTPTKISVGTARLETDASRLQVLHCTTEPGRTLINEKCECLATRSAFTTELVNPFPGNQFLSLPN